MKNRLIICVKKSTVANLFLSGYHVSRFLSGNLHVLTSLYFGMKFYLAVLTEAEMSKSHFDSIEKKNLLFKYPTQRKRNERNS